MLNYQCVHDVKKFIEYLDESKSHGKYRLCWVS